MVNFWTKISGDTLLTLEEQVTIAPFSLPLSQPNATVTIISGALPGGLYLDGTQLRGTPREVSKEETSTFVMRATCLLYTSDAADE